ncbi:hypothetical protein [Sphingobium sp. WCS2017Hpa-17]|uniref:hypothetical protein n=1 Tax=Sphingobium sp. WCS2017Hpa-17 TaxID=3073638 RepID=UPI00288B274D|nr:hypothetical protein [Sphingobium sp. WCS2017Hpa-17]
MTPEETARFHADRPGYELIDYAEVCLPIFKIYMVASLLQHTPLPPIYEFVLRTIRLGIDDADGIAACLGIPGRMVQDTLRSLHDTEEVAFKTGDSNEIDRFVLTRKGEKTTASLERIRPEQQTVPIYFDGLTRKPIEPPAQTLLSGKQPEELGLKEIPSLPATRIEVPDIDITEAARIFGRERSEGRRDLLAIKTIERRMRLHLPVTALVFRPIEGGEVELLFASDNQLLDEHNRAFALAEGPRKTRLLAEFAKADQVGSDSFARRVSQLAKSVDAPKPKSSTAKRTTLRARSAVPDGALQRLTVLDHPPLLRDAIETAEQRVMIFSPWITPLVVDRPTILAFRKLLDRQVTLHVGYGLDDDRKATKPIPEEFQKLADEFPNFQLRRFGDTHEKVLIKDDEYVVLTSFNWLSFRGDAERKLRRELGIKVSDQAYVEKEYALLEARFRARSRKKASEEG